MAWGGDTKEQDSELLVSLGHRKARYIPLHRKLPAVFKGEVGR